jgi:hypothetical protein
MQKARIAANKHAGTVNAQAALRDVHGVIELASNMRDAPSARKSSR